MKRIITILGIIILGLLAITLFSTCDISSPFVDLIQGKIYADTELDNKYNAIGTLDTTFGINGVAVYDGGNDDWGIGFALDTNGRILMSGYSNNGTDYDMAIWRYK
ncbi:MAG: hypothetical protein DRP58_04255 [Spirochaetes bacterium]|nr:MAG: hypothetical protein DRP58_04255 [Spirochaetota bacterium]